MTVSPALAAALAAARPALNARVAAARKAQPGFDAAALGQAIRDQLDPLIVAVAAVAPDRAAAVTLAGFDMVVSLVGQRLIGPATRHPFVNRLWAEVAPAYAGAIAESPAATLGRLTNATVRLAATPGVRMDEWLALLAALAPLADRDTLGGIGQIAAWRAGMAHYRDGALAAGDALPEPVALAAVGVTGAGWAEVRARFAADPWWSGGGTPAPRTFGGFSGFGGPFAEPPAVAAVDQGFIVRSGDRHGLLIVDAFGATIHPATADDYDGAVRHATPIRIAGLSVTGGDRVIAAGFPADGLAAVANAHSLAIFSPYSHFVSFHPWRLP